MTEIRVGLVPVDGVQFHPHNVRRDLGDLRALADSIRRYGVLQPLVVEVRAGGLRLRAGHRRLAAARLAGVRRVPAVIHPEALGEREWLEQAVQENVMRADMDDDDRRRTILALRQLGCSWAGLGETFGVPAAKVRGWATEDDPAKERRAKGTKGADVARRRKAAVTRLIAAHPADWERVCAEVGYVTRAVKVDQARRLHAAGVAPYAIAKQLGYSTATSLAHACYHEGERELGAALQRGRTRSGNA